VASITLRVGCRADALIKKIERTETLPKFDPRTGLPFNLYRDTTTYEFRGVEHEHLFLAVQAIPLPKALTEFATNYSSYVLPGCVPQLELCQDFISFVLLANDYGEPALLPAPNIEAAVCATRRGLDELGYPAVSMGVFAINTPDYGDSY
jgi:hypothetical protein